MREVVKFQPNTPVRVALKYATGKPVQGNYGPQMMFTLDDDRVMYLDPGPAAMVATLNPTVGEPFTVVVKWTGKSAEKREWDVYRHIIRNDQSELERNLEGSLVRVAGRKAAASANQAVPAEEEVQARGTGTYGPTPAASPKQQLGPAPKAKPIPTKRQYADAFAFFLVDAVRATTAAEKTVSAEGLSVRFDATAIQAIATTMFIQAGKDGFIEWDGGGR